ncbi:MotA/TolQ/ExbB proton channel family protein [Hyphomicrobium sp.]|uniref:MotA/TolQ/ExbB proton channel family protein n=1 Tax=Hyphomicrobium sp. TaxID=82 RepID=UPI002CFA5947|nr:MotA/TolQ/ExbB proton channel family protein [Hyphomicrobium sp.]HRN87598.1 MotA/TolQ/ExbB proton channel family protein [Hyphomicrobium sp.]HRQ27977.1 MotA/TolQ/ExbB proton channel family protein [Hyphomicrobium sp.]
MEQVGAEAVHHSLSIWDFIFDADPVVKAVMVILVVLSVTCWAIIFEKAVRLAKLRRELKRLERTVGSDTTLTDAPRGLVRTLLSAAHSEANEGASRNESRTDLRARLERSMRGALKAELQRLEAGLPFLATTGSAAPFIGLFGTVWGIMNSFTAIASQKDTSLAVVAPGIAEALFVTALGLAAAIPAVMAYNQIAVSLGRGANRGNTTITELARRLSQPQSDQARSGPTEALRAGASF